MDDTALVISAVLIPRFKLQWVPEADRDRVIQLLKTEVSRLPHREHHVTSDPPATGEPEDFFSFDEEGHCRRDSEAQDVMLYLQSDDKDVKDILKYPTLHSLFLKFNAAVPSSASVERLFSLAGDVFRRKRGKLSDKNFEIQLLLRANKLFW